MKNADWERVIDMDKTSILSQTKDSLIVLTEDLIDTMHILQQSWRSLIDLIDDHYIKKWFTQERYLLCYAKWLFLKKINLIQK